jgi:hypothetical protein
VPPETAWLLPELELGADPELNPLEELEPELELAELDPVEEDPVEEPEFDELDEPVEPVEDEPVEPDVSVLCVEPGRPSATTPATATLARPIPVVAERTLA